jgi:hypothetical protein
MISSPHRMKGNALSSWAPADPDRAGPLDHTGRIPETKATSTTRAIPPR